MMLRNFCLKRILIPFLLIGYSCGFAQNTIGITEVVISHLEKNQTNKIYKLLSSSSKSKITKKQLKTLWTKQLEDQGKVESHGDIELDTVNGSNTTTTELYQEKNTLILVLRVTEKGKIDRLFFLPKSYGMPDAARNAVFGKRQLSVKTDTFELNGELIFPLHVVQAPVAILVHGSGASDLDETIGPNKIFKDLALELAMKGIATFRYNKRAFSYPETIKKGVDFNILEETIDDASSAIEMLSGIEEIDTSKIFVLGHSLGAYAAPWIADINPRISGIIMMGAPSQPIFELLPMQFEYMFGLDNHMSFVEKQFLRRVKKQTVMMRKGNFDQIKSKTFAGTYWPPSYFKFIQDYSPLSTLDSTECPVLILQGGRDYQVPLETQFVPFQKAHHENPLIKFKVFDDLNHLFLFGEGPSVPSEYIRPGHVDSQVIDVISDWIDTH